MEPDKTAKPLPERRVINIGSGLALFTLGAFWVPAAAFTLANLNYLRSPLNANEGNLLATAVVDLLCLGLTLFSAHLCVVRVEIDNTHISWTNMLGRHRSMPLRDLQSDMILVTGKGGRFLRLHAHSGTEVKIGPGNGVSLEELRDDVVRRCREAAGFEVSTTGPVVTPQMERSLTLTFLLLPWSVVIGVLLWNLLKHYGLLGP